METYPYDIPDDKHPLSWVFFNAGGIAPDLDTCEALAKHVFDDLGCGAPGTTHEPVVLYDALGGSGGPWEPGAWPSVEDGRMLIVASAPSVNVTSMSDEQAAELQAALDARLDAIRADAVREDTPSDETDPPPGMGDIASRDENAGEGD